jgi:hypothetical protein
VKNQTLSALLDVALGLPQAATTTELENLGQELARKLRGGQVAGEIEISTNGVCNDPTRDHACLPNDRT